MILTRKMIYYHKKFIPKVESAYATIQSERDRRYVMGTAKRDTETSTIISNNRIGSQFFCHTSLRERSNCSQTNPRHQSTVGPRKTSRDGGAQKNMRCTHRGKFHHIKAECFQLIRWKSQRRDSVGADNVVTTLIGS